MIRKYWALSKLCVMALGGHCSSFCPADHTTISPSYREAVHDCKERNLCCDASLSQINPIIHLLSEQNEGKPRSQQVALHTIGREWLHHANNSLISLVNFQFFYSQVMYFAPNILAHLSWPNTNCFSTLTVTEKLYFLWMLLSVFMESEMCFLVK